MQHREIAVADRGAPHGKAALLGLLEPIGLRHVPEPIGAGGSLRGSQ
jgi:hypothetical protein